MKLAELIKTKREALGMSQMRLAHEAGVSLSTVVNIECGRTIPIGNFSITDICSELSIDPVRATQAAAEDHLVRSVKAAREKAEKYLCTEDINRAIISA